MADPEALPHPEVLHIHATVRRVGNSLAVLIPAEEARRVGMKEGDPVDADVRTGPLPALGLLKGKLRHEPFSRRSLDRDRV